MVTLCSAKFKVVPAFNGLKCTIMRSGTAHFQNGTTYAKCTVYSRMRFGRAYLRWWTFEIVKSSCTLSEVHYGSF